MRKVECGGYDLDGLLATLFEGTSVHEEMAREFKSHVLFSSEKASGRRDSELIRRYVEALAGAPEDWFRLRDCDGLAKFYIAAALACNDSDAGCLTDEEYDVLGEAAFGMYDAVAFYKHRAEGEICNTFAYADPGLRQEAFRIYREALWGLDQNWSHQVTGRCALGFVRAVGGPIHTMMRRYRFAEEGLTIGAPETRQVIEETRSNKKLWYRIDADAQSGRPDERYNAVMAQRSRLLFPGLAQMLNKRDSENCPDCRRRDSYGAEEPGRFGGVTLCTACQRAWNSYLLSFPARAASVLPISSPKPRAQAAS